MTSVEIIFQRDGVQYAPPEKLLAYGFERLLDEPGKGNLVYSAGGKGCCDFVREAMYLDKVLMLIDGRQEWEGWLTSVRSSDQSGNITIQAYDAMQWLAWRVIHQNHSHVDTDLAYIFEDYFLDAMSVGNPGVDLIVSETGILSTREVFYTDMQYTIDVADELLREGLDAIVVGNQIVIGGLDMGTIALNSGNLNAKPDLFKTIEPFGNSFYGVGDDDVVASCTSPDTQFPVVERIIQTPEVSSQAELQEIMDRYCERHDDLMVFIESPSEGGMQLNCELALADILPGLGVNYDATDTCGGFVERNVISAVRVNGSPNTAVANIELSPAGGLPTDFDSPDPVRRM